MLKNLGLQVINQLEQQQQTAPLGNNAAITTGSHENPPASNE